MIGASNEIPDRVLNSLHHSSWLQSTDSEELDRQNIQHDMLQAHLGSLYWPVDLVREVLAPKPDAPLPPAVLDIGSGSGRWLSAMGQEFPHVQFTGIDLLPCEFTDPQHFPPRNCSFVVDDVNKGLAHYKDFFDVIHVRASASGVRDFRAFLDELQHILRPGGVLLVFNRDPPVYDEDEQPLPVVNEGEPRFSWTAKMIALTREAIAAKRKATPSYQRTRGPGSEASIKTYSWLEEMGDKWASRGQHRFFIPVGAWKSNMSESERNAAELLQENCSLVCLSSFLPTLLEAGYPQAEVDRWIAETRAEVSNMTAHINIGWTASWAQKPRTS